MADGMGCLGRRSPVRSDITRCLMAVPGIVMCAPSCLDEAIGGGPPLNSTRRSIGHESEQIMSDRSAKPALGQWRRISSCLTYSSASAGGAHANQPSTIAARNALFVTAFNSMRTAE